jgi:hypothetical protein
LKGKNKLVKKKHEKNCFEIGMMRKGKGKWWEWSIGEREAERSEEDLGKKDGEGLWKKVEVGGCNGDEKEMWMKEKIWRREIESWRSGFVKGSEKPIRFGDINGQGVSDRCSDRPGEKEYVYPMVLGSSPIIEWIKNSILLKLGLVPGLVFLKPVAGAVHKGTVLIFFECFVRTNPNFWKKYFLYSESHLVDRDRRYFESKRKYLWHFRVGGLGYLPKEVRLNEGIRLRRGFSGWSTVNKNLAKK